ncbi:MAG: TonB-dependent receptor [Halomonadaceae bacterium]|nr:MAG: TonB-dependent receptor [Halomonadaceae bacterium]
MSKRRVLPALVILGFSGVLPPGEAIAGTSSVAEADTKGGSEVAAFKVASLDKLSTLVVTGTRTEKMLADSPVKVDVVTREEMENRQVNTVAEALKFVPGVQLQRIHGDEGQQVVMQGMSGDQVVVLIDGMPVSASTGSTVNLSRLSLGRVERIEVVRGATSALHGSAAMGGVVNIITTTPDKPELRLGWRGTDFADQNTDQAKGGVLAEQRVNLRATSGPVGIANSQLSLDWQDNSGSGRDPESRTHDTFSGQTLSGSHRLALAPGAHRLRWDIDGFEADLSRPVDREGVPFRYGDHTRRLGTGLTWERPAQVFGLNLDSKTQGRFEWFEQTTTQDAVRTEALEQERSAQMQTGMVGQQWDTVLANNLLTLGLDYQYDALEQSQTRESMDGTVADTREVPPRSQEQASVYLQNDMSVGTRLELLPGIRVQWDEGFGVFTAPKMNARWNPAFLDRDGFKGHLRGGVGVGYRAPNLKERYYFFDHSQLGYRVEGNPDLEPEKNRSWQLGTGLNGQRWGFDLGVYLNQAENLIVADLNEDRSAQESVDIYQYQNIDRADIRGLDTELTLNPGQAWQLRLAYSLTHARSRNDGHHLPGRTPHVITAGLDLQPTQRLQLNTSLRHQSATWADRENTQRTPAWVDLESVLNIDITGHLRLFVGGENLLDELQPVSSSGDTRPLIGRRLFMGVEGRF